jgi:fused signal recognition particle receptor
MFSFFKKTSAPADQTPAVHADAKTPVAPALASPGTERRTWLDKLRGTQVETLASTDLASASAPVSMPAMPTLPVPDVVPADDDRRGWIDRLRGGLRKTGTSIAQVFTGTKIDDALYEELEAALLMADAGVKATEHLLADLKRRVKETKATDPAAVKGLLADAITELLDPLEQPLRVGEHVPTVIMVVGVNGAGKTTSIGKLTRHLADAGKKVLLAAADTFRAAAREQLVVWAERADGRSSAAGSPVEIVSQQGGDPAAVTFDAVVAGKARGCDVVIADTAGRLTTQVHLMEELKKVRRVIAKAQAGAPHEVLLVVDGNTGQNALTQVQIFDAALQLTGLIITKLDGTAKGGVLAAVALWSRERVRSGGLPLPVYFIGVGEKLEDLQTFSAREFAQALLA